MTPTKPFGVVFAGTPEFAAEILSGLLAAQFNVELVLTQPDRPTGRGRKTRPSAVKETALANTLPLIQPENIDAAVIEKVASIQPRVAVVAAYGLILPQAFLDLPELGCINLHASLLPRWRGAAPIQRAILAGDDVSGVTVMQMDAGLDTGDSLATLSCAIEAGDTAQILQDRLALLARKMLPDALLALSNGELIAHPQDPKLATYAKRLSKSEGLIDWNESARLLERKVRALNPWPVAYSPAGEQRIRIWETSIVADANDGEPGIVMAAGPDGIYVGTGDGVLRLETLQFPGGRRLPARELVNAGRLPPGTRLGG